jgi:hypothetical protein
MTLGTARNFRRYGLGSMLIESIITMIENEGNTSTTTSSSSMGLEENDTYETAMQKGRALAMYGRPTQLTGVLYLHVIIYNTGAMRMYERLGFIRVKEIQGKNTSTLELLNNIFIFYIPISCQPTDLSQYTTYEIILPLSSSHTFSLFNTFLVLQIITQSTLSITIAIYMHDTFMAMLVIIILDQSWMLCTAMPSPLFEAFLDTKAATIIC